MNKKVKLLLQKNKINNNNLIKYNFKQNYNNYLNNNQNKIIQNFKIKYNYQNKKINKLIKYYKI